MTTTTDVELKTASAYRPERNDGDWRALEAELRSKVEGEVRFDNGSRALYSTDASNYRQIPIGVVIPRSVQDVEQTVALCRKFGAPILPRGGGTSLAGQCCNVAVVIDFSKYMNRVVEIDPDKKTARVQPGLILDDLRDAANNYNLTYGPDPATHSRCTLGGMIGNNSCGVHSVIAGMTSDNIEELELVTYDGLRLKVDKTSEPELASIIRQGGRRAAIYARLKELRDKYAGQIRQHYPDIPRRVSGYNLPALLPENGFNVAAALVGSEGTCATVLEATVRLVYWPPVRTLVVLGYPDVYQACDHVPQIMQHKPIGLEGFDNYLISDMKKKNLLPDDVALLPEGGGWLLVEFGGKDLQDAGDQARAFMDAANRFSGNKPNTRLFENPGQQDRIWAVREAALGATAQVPGEKPEWPGWEDSSVPPDKVGNYLRDLRKLLDSYGYKCSFYGHFGQGCIHLRIDFDFQSAEGRQSYLNFMSNAADLVLSYGGSLSGEHGDGQSRAELLPRMFGAELVQAFNEFKSIWDPDWKMNPGKVVRPYRMDENLRLGEGYHPWQPVTHFRFPDDQGSLTSAVLRCVGVGKCRRLEGGTMCPSFMVTREEEHSTRGRSRMLFEMLQGDVIQADWRDEHVKDALDLCLACKGCKGECPVNVDMATYKSEFLSHYYAGRLRPITGYTMGQIHLWARLASLAPGIANFLTQTPLLRDLFKAAGGIAPQRRIPTFASPTFKQWYKQQAVLNGDRRPATDELRRSKFQGRQGHSAPSTVLLWPDTFNNHFHPDTLRAGLEVLQSAGCDVVVPLRPMCCGRPLYDWGMLNQAKYLLRQILDTLRDEIRAGTPVVVLEPSCAAVFRDELVNLFPDDPDARRLSAQTFLLSEFLQKKLPAFRLPRLERKAIVHGHCHHKAIMRMDDEVALLSRIGLDYKLLDSGCCGMAGAFGFERGEHFDVSVKAGERVLLPAVRQAGADTLIIAGGFSCREQIAQCTDREALHPAQVVRMALGSR